MTLEDLSQHVHILQKNCFIGMIHKILPMDAYVLALKKSSKKSDMPRFFVVIFTRIFYVLQYKNTQLTVFRNDEGLFGRLIITFITFVSISYYYFFLDMFLLSFLFFIFTLFQINQWLNIYHLHFLFYTQKLVLLLSNKNKESLFLVVFRRENLC